MSKPEAPPNKPSLPEGYQVPPPARADDPLRRPRFCAVGVRGETCSHSRTPAGPRCLDVPRAAGRSGVRVHVRVPMRVYADACGALR
jgi:hypothetical protein